MDKNFLIIIGTEKAGTTSLFEYFINHVDIISSVKKETDYFRQDSCNLDEYLSCFSKIDDKKIYFESSPGYLGTSFFSARNIHNVLSDKVKLIAVLRDPIERLKSSFSFHKSKQYIPKDFDINEYVGLCLEHEKDNLPVHKNPFPSEWFLNVLNAGKYKSHLQNFSNYYDINSIHLIDFHELKSDVKSVVLDICNFSNLDQTYFKDFDFYKANQTFQVKSGRLHRFGMVINNKLEPVLRRNPKLKQYIVGKYKAFNGDNSYVERPLSKESFDKLVSYYDDDYFFVKELFKKRGKNISWSSFDDR